MNPKLAQPLIPIERIDSILQIEPGLLIVTLALGAWFIYKFLLRKVSPERHQNLSKLFSNLALHIVLGIVLFMAYLGLRQAESDRLAAYFGLAALLVGCAVFVKTWRILVFEYLFLGHMKVGVPLLLVNLFTLVFSICLGGWLVSEIFNIKLTPILATSAIFSLVLGLGLQDTLGNLFAGVALQFDKPYEIGDWIEISNGGQKWVGQVHEITWRATVLLGWTEEIMTIPNRVVSQSQISNFATKTRPIIRSQAFKLPYGKPARRVKETLLQAAASVPAIRKNPSPIVFITETTESWLTYKLIYFVDDYGAQFMIGDQVISASVEALEKAGMPIASPRLTLVHPESREQTPS